MLQTLKFLLRHPLNMDSRGGALVRFLRWQISTRLLSVPHTMPFVDDTVLLMERGMTGATGNWYCGLHEHADMGFVLHVLRPDDIFVDIGANVGSYTVLASGAAGAYTIAFEPVPATYAKLLRNISANSIGDRVTAHNLGLGKCDEILRFTAGRDTTNHVVTGPTDAPTVDVQVRRLADMLEGAVPRMIKLDVEGWEAEVLEGAKSTLADPALAAIITETNESAGRYGGSGDDRVARIMQAHGFSAYSYDPVRRLLVAGGTGHNTIFARDVDFLQDRIARAPHFHLVNGMI